MRSCMSTQDIRATQRPPVRRERHEYIKAYLAATGGSVHRHGSMLPTIHDLISHVKEHIAHEGL
eukprot:2370195-Prymnesium_polylepis.1